MKVKTQDLFLLHVLSLLEYLRFHYFPRNWILRDIIFLYNAKNSLTYTYIAV